MKRVWLRVRFGMKVKKIIIEAIELLICDQNCYEPFDCILAIELYWVKLSH